MQISLVAKQSSSLAVVLSLSRSLLQLSQFCLQHDKFYLESKGCDCNKVEYQLPKAHEILSGYLVLISIATYLTSTSLEMHRPSPKTQPFAPDLECNNEKKHRSQDASLCTKALSWALGCRPLDVEVTHDLRACQLPSRVLMNNDHAKRWINPQIPLLSLKS